MAHARAADRSVALFPSDCKDCGCSRATCHAAFMPHHMIFVPVSGAEHGTAHSNMLSRRGARPDVVFGRRRPDAVRRGSGPPVSALPRLQGSQGPVSRRLSHGVFGQLGLLLLVGESRKHLLQVLTARLQVARLCPVLVFQDGVDCSPDAQDVFQDGVFRVRE